jgi:hypothetical protein
VPKYPGAVTVQLVTRFSVGRMCSFVFIPVMHVGSIPVIHGRPIPDFSAVSACVHTRYLLQFYSIPLSYNHLKLVAFNIFLFVSVFLCLQVFAYLMMRSFHSACGRCLRVCSLPAAVCSLPCLLDYRYRGLGAPSRSPTLKVDTLATQPPPARPSHIRKTHTEVKATAAATTGATTIPIETAANQPQLQSQR